MEKAFEKSHPFVMACYFIVSTVAIMVINHPLFLIASFVIAIFNAKLFVSTSTLLKVLKGSLLFVVIMVTINIFLNQNGTTEIIRVFGQTITLEVITYSCIMSFMLLLIFQLSLLFNETMNGAKLMYVLSKLVPKTGLVTMLALRYVPLLKVQLQQIMTVQKLKGYSMTEGTLIERIKSGLLLLQLLLTISLEDALQTAESMKARGYGLKIKRTSYTPYIWSIYDSISIIILVVIFLSTIISTFTGLGMITVYPKLQISWSSRHIIISFLGCLIIAFPLILQSLEWCKWKFYSLKM